MAAIRLFGVFVVFGLVSSLEAQVIDARENLIQLVNPPRALTKPKAASPVDSVPLLFAILQVSTELDNAKAEGLGPDHPRIKGLQAKLAAMQNQLQATPAKTASPTASQSLLDRLAALEARQQEKEATLAREVAALKAEVTRLQEELKKVQK